MAIPFDPRNQLRVSLSDDWPRTCTGAGNEPAADRAGSVRDRAGATAGRDGLVADHGRGSARERRELRQPAAPGSDWINVQGRPDNPPMGAPFPALNDQQRAAATFGAPGPRGMTAGPLLVIAGAGTGKTSTLAHRVAQLAMSGV